MEPVFAALMFISFVYGAQDRAKLVDANEEQQVHIEMLRDAAVEQSLFVDKIHETQQKLAISHSAVAARDHTLDEAHALEIELLKLRIKSLESQLAP
jgi:hypothetical protein|tara:strand:- start:24960 stop:25250 length:291 start_codon:yes stop_codon:yes gene_type:complete